VFSVGGGDLQRNISPNLVKALQYAKQVGAAITGVVGRDGGFTATVADACVIVPTANPATVTPHSEAFQAVVWHLLVSHPSLKVNPTKW
jgi:D-sedoheptulose 7-phosphate isomerase